LPLPFEPRCDRQWPDWEAVREALPAHADCDRIAVMGSTCLPAGEPPPGAVPLWVTRTSTCFSLLADDESVDAWISRGCYLVTPGWLRQWRDAVAAWGYDEATARAHFSEFATTVLLLDTGLDADAAVRLREFAGFLGLRAEVHRVTLDAFCDRLARAVQCPP